MADGLQLESMAAAVRDELRRIAASPAFRSSRRCQKLLEYVVTETLEGRTEELKERTIGVVVFGRRPDYDTSEDSSVRVTAGEVRKRLAQYYVENGHASGIRIDLPPGSYVALIHEAPPTAVPALPESPEPARGRSLKAWVIAAVLVLSAAALFLAVRGVRTPRPTDTPTLRAFWAPVTQGAPTVLMCLGGQFTYMPRSPLAHRVLSRLPSERDLENSALDPRPDDKITAADLRGAIDEQVATGDAHASVLISHLLGRLEKNVEFRLTYTSTLDDIRRTPAVFVGAFNNRWSMAAGARLPFHYAGDWTDGTHHIVDSANGRKYAFSPTTEGRRYPVEHALISRVLHSESGRPFVQIGGFGHAGTLAAGQRVTSERLFGELVSRLPADWAQRNVQAVLRVTVVNGNPTDVQVVATRVW